MAADRVCRDVRRKLLDYAEQELCAAEVQGVGDHVARCADCKAALDELETTLGALRQVRVLRPSPTFWANTLVGVRRKIEHKRRPWPARLAPALGLAATLALAVVLLSRQLGTGPAIQRSVQEATRRAAVSGYDADYLMLADMLEDSADAVQAVAGELLSGDGDALMEYAAALTDSQWTRLLTPLEWAVDDYLIEASDLDVLIEELGDQDEPVLMEHIQRARNG